MGMLGWARRAGIELVTVNREWAEPEPQLP